MLRIHRRANDRSSRKSSRNRISKKSKSPKHSKMVPEEATIDEHAQNNGITVSKEIYTQGLLKSFASY